MDQSIIMGSWLRHVKSKVDIDHSLLLVVKVKSCSGMTIELGLFDVSLTWEYPCIYARIMDNEISAGMDVSI